MNNLTFQLASVAIRHPSLPIVSLSGLDMMSRVVEDIERLMFPFTHDDVTKWKHFPIYWPFARWIHRSPVNSLHKGQWRGTLMFSFICAWINGWVNNGDADDLRHHRGHYDVTVMKWYNLMNILTVYVSRSFALLSTDTGVRNAHWNILKSNYSNAV